MFLRISVLFPAAALGAPETAATLVAGIAKQTIRAQLIDSKASALSERNDEDSGIPAFIFAMLMPADVISFIFIGLQREVVDFCPCQGAELTLQGGASTIPAISGSGSACSSQTLQVVLAHLRNG
jgi:hypothetical protein